MLTELTYISAVQQDPREIHNAPVSNTHKEKYYSYKLLRVDLEKLLMNIHVGEWETTETRETRYTFSKLLELTQRSWQLGKFRKLVLGSQFLSVEHRTPHSQDRETADTKSNLEHPTMGPRPCQMGWTSLVPETPLRKS